MSAYRFPFATPYDIQMKFMDSLYRDVLGHPKVVGIFESPTGTGKSLSVACSTLQWLLDQPSAFPESDEENDVVSKGSEKEPSWVMEYVSNRKREMNELREISLQKRRERCAKKAKRLKNEGITDEQSCSSSDEGDNIIDGEEIPHTRKVYYSSRTHSQLSQFLSEVKRTDFKDKICGITLGSRASLCINEKVKKLRNVMAMNDACADLHGSGTSNRCPFLDEESMENFVGIASTCEPRDIEDIAKLGKDLGACPYYGARRVVPSAHLVVVPYQMLLHEDTRSSLGIKLKNQVVIFDEAHNVIDALSNCYGVFLPAIQIRRAHDQLQAYYTKYRERLASRNWVHIRRILDVVSKLMDIFVEKNESKDDVMMNVNEFLVTAHLDHVDFFPLVEYLQNGDLLKKLNGFVESENQSDEKNNVHMTRVAMYSVKSILQVILNSDMDGRIILRRKDTRLRPKGMQYVLLNPFVYFNGVVESARNVVLVGGTLEPLSDIKDILLRGVSPDLIHVFQCGHVIPRSSILTNALGCGPSGITLEFSFANRENRAMIEDLGSSVANMCSVIPDGIVCFFPSYSFMQFVTSKWKECMIWSRIEQRKKIFLEPRESGGLDQLLTSYQGSIEEENGNGALLLCVVGGKLSEGINFQDGLGRGIIVVGLPYPDRGDVELVERMHYLDSVEKCRGRISAGEEYYENLCIKGVNQSVGRSIRHIGDYAVILLMDSRFGRQHVRSKLPQWITRDMPETAVKFGVAFRNVAKFFSSKKK